MTDFDCIICFAKKDSTGNEETSSLQLALELQFGLEASVSPAASSSPGLTTSLSAFAEVC